MEVYNTVPTTALQPGIHRNQAGRSGVNLDSEIKYFGFSRINPGAEFLPIFRVAFEILEIEEKLL